MTFGLLHLGELGREAMGLLLWSSPTPLSFSCLDSFSSNKPFAASPLLAMRLPLLPLKKQPPSAPSISLGGLCCRYPLTVRASTLLDGLGVGEDQTASSESDDDDEEALLLGYHVLDPKLQRKLEQRMRMKVGKHVRLRRKKLERRRRMRKKVCSKPNKNV